MNAALMSEENLPACLPMRTLFDMPSSFRDRPTVCPR